jgi:hypothetical protein
MRNLGLLMAAALGIAMSCAPAGAQVAPPFTVTGSNGGNIVLNQNTGAITLCDGHYTGAGPFTPDGTCIKIGTATPSAGTLPSLVATWSTGNPFFVTNVNTGKVWQCDSYLSASGSFVGSCILEGTAF